MKRRVYYLIPDATGVKFVIDELVRVGIAKNSIHILSKSNADLSLLSDPNYTKLNRRTMLFEWLIWDSTLALFFVSLIVLFSMLALWPTVWIIVPIIFMVTSFIAGAWYAINVPFVHTDEFRYALAHNEILLVLDIDTSIQSIPSLTQFIQRQYPVAVSGGVSWHSTLLHQ